jgi:hypothetical protein
MLPDGFGCRVCWTSDRVLVQVGDGVPQRIYGMVAASEIATTINQLGRA